MYVIVNLGVKIGSDRSISHIQKSWGSYPPVREGGLRVAAPRLNSGNFARQVDPEKLTSTVPEVCRPDGHTDQPRWTREGGYLPPPAPPLCTSFPLLTDTRSYPATGLFLPSKCEIV